VALGLALFAGCAGWAAHEVGGFDVRSLARVTPARTALMRQRQAEARAAGRTLEIDAQVVPYDRISPLLRRAVLIAEDDAFYSHDGLDWNELRQAARTNLARRRVVRGGSTITQQLAKNLYLGTERSLQRKLEEALLAIRLERALTKRRIFELYLNRIEWGDGIFGVESAARRYFGTSAADLTARQAVLLAAVIINPRRFSVLAPPARIERRVRIIAGRMRRRGYLSDAEYREAVGLAPPPPSIFRFLPWFHSEPDTMPPAPEGPVADSSATAP
jgi:monofunctional biosynthetic peptidoglycan transglycosylase